MYAATWPVAFWVDTEHCRPRPADYPIGNDMQKGLALCSAHIVLEASVRGILPTLPQPFYERRRQDCLYRFLCLIESTAFLADP